MSKRMIVVIPTSGEAKLLPRTLKSLGTCRQPAVFSHVVVVENGPPAEAAEASKHAPSHLKVDYHHVERANKSNALNEVFASFDDEDLIYLVDDDIRFANNVLEDYAAAAEGVGGGCVFGGPLRIDSEGQAPEKWKLLLPGSMVGWAPERFDDRAGFFLGANWGVFAGDVRRAGGFDPRFGPGSPLNATGQEWSMQIALRKLGCRFRYLPGAMVWHYVDFRRFSVDFLIKRKYRGGVEAGIRSADFMHTSPRWHDHIRHPLLRAQGRRWKHRLLAHWAKLKGDDTAELKHSLEVEHARGFLHGYPIAFAELRNSRIP